MLYNKKLRRGFLYDKLRNDERSKKQCDANNGSDNVEDIGTADIPTSDESELLTYLKTYVVKNGVTDLKRKLAESVDVRRNLLHKDISEIKKMFPFYFADPLIVSSSISYLFSFFSIANKLDMI